MNIVAAILFATVSLTDESYLQSKAVSALVDKFMSSPPIVDCTSIFKPERQADMMANLFNFYQKHEDKPYLCVIIENWLLVRKNIGYCESGWEVGDLNSDGRVDMEDLAMYGSVK